MNTEMSRPDAEPAGPDDAIVSKISTSPLFNLGRIVATPGALDLLELGGADAASFLRRHKSGDFGDLCADDIRENLGSIQNGCRILSSYQVGSGRLWIITKADRSVTTLLLPSEY